MSSSIQTETPKCCAITKTGKKCCYKSKQNSLYCGIHKNYINTSKSLFTDEKKIELNINNLKHTTMLNTTEQIIELTINFFDGSNMKIDNAYDMSIDDVKIEINGVKTDMKKKQMSLFVVGEEDELTTYNNQTLLFCLIKEADELIIENDIQIDDYILETDYEKMDECLTSKVVELFNNNKVMEDIDCLREYISDEMADYLFNSDHTHSQYKVMWKDDDAVFTTANGSSSIQATLVKFHTIKDYINDQLEYEDSSDEKIDMDNYKQLYAYALAKEWCNNVSISSTAEKKKNREEFKEGIKDLVIKKMYWEVNEDVCNRLDDYDEEDEEDAPENETDEERRTRQYPSEFEYVCDAYYEIVDSWGEDEVEDFIRKTLTNDGRHEFHIKQKNHELYLPDCLGDIEMSKENIMEIINENSVYSQEYYERFV